MTSCYDLGSQVGVKASEIIDDTPSGYVVIGGRFDGIGPGLRDYDDLPTSKLVDAVTHFSTALNAVAIAGQGSSGVVSESVTVQPNQVFANMDRIASDVDNWLGGAATSFADNYKAQLPYVADAQFTGISVALTALEAQHELYTTAYDSIQDTCNKTLSALEAADGRGGASAAFALTVLAATGTVAVTVLTAGTATAPALAITIAVASGAASAGAAGTALDFSADTPEQVMDKFFEAVGKVETHVRTRQREIAQGVKEYAAAVNDDLARTTFAEGEYPTFTFKPTGLANGPGGLGEYGG